MSCPCDPADKFISGCLGHRDDCPHDPNPETAFAFFVNDHPNGYELECQGCKHTAIYSDHTSDWVCRKCQRTLWYPPGAVW